jgi:signal transduction histidine kinase
MEETMTRSNEGHPGHPVRRWVPFIVLAGTLLAAVAVSQYVRSTASTKDRLRFQTAVQDTVDAVDRRLETYIAMLRATAALFAASEGVTSDEFRAFVEHLELGERYPGVQAIGFSVQVQPAEVDALVARIRKEGVQDFRIWPEGTRRLYHTIVYIEPLNRRGRAMLGYDMSTEPARRAAMERARDTGRPAATGRVELVLEVAERRHEGFLVYVPVYRHGLPAASVEERRRALVGFVYGAFRADSLLTGVLDLGRQGLLDLQVLDAGRPGSDTVMYDTERSRGRVALHTHRLAITRTLDVAGRAWLLAFTTGPAFEASSDYAAAPVVLVVGFAFGLALFGVTRSQVGARVRAERVAAELRQAEQEREQLLAREREARAEAQAANRAKDLFLAALSHELRTPLNAILGWARMLRDGQLNTEQRQQALEVIERNAQAQARLIGDLLDVSRIITGKLRVDLRPMEFGSAVEAALDSVRPAAEAKGLTLEWSAREPAPVLGDPERAQQIVWNLLSNAIKFTPRGGRVDVRLVRIGSEVKLVVRDTGIGIPPEFLPHVFERFSQADDGAARSHAGLGLGLAIARHLTEMQGGTIRAESAGEGRGSTFVVCIPVRACEERAVNSE